METVAPRVRNDAGRDRQPIGPWALYGAMGLLLAAYFVSVVIRGPGDTWPWLDNWGVAGFELTASCLGLARLLVRRDGRAVPLVIGTALLAWSIGDVLLAAESAGGATPPTPSWADLSYLMFYPLIYVGLMLLWRRGIKRFSPALWLDGAVAGLGAAAVCAAFAFHTLVHSAGGSPLAVATDLAYPIGDVLLFALVIAASATLPGRKKASWILLATGCAVNAVGDTANLFQSKVAPSHIGYVLNAAAWPTALLLMSLALWVQPRRRAPDTETAPGFALPGLAAASALTIVCYGALHPISRVALALGAATLMAAGVRMALSLRSLRALTAERHRQAITDALTGLGNRRQLSELLDVYFGDDGPRTSLAFLYIDLNHFKEVNDAFGHASGDQLLQQLGPRLVTVLRSSDLLARIGGDELAVVLLDSDAARAKEVAGRLAATFDEPFVLDVVSVRVGASIGIALAPEDADDSAGLLRCADAAMYRAKVSGTPFEVYETVLDQTSNRLLLAEELREAVERDELVLHYQTQVDLHDPRTLAVEALLRWFHPRLGPVPPLDFLPLAEEAGIMRSLTAMVLGKAMSQCAAWRAQGHDVETSVNISASNLLDAGFADLVRELLELHDLPADLITLEITETTIIRDFERSKVVIAQLHALGLHVSVDDFGAGFTSLAYLVSLAVDELKLDRTFVTPLTSGEIDRARPLLRATIELGHAMGMRVVAEGVEDTHTLELLTRLGCDRVQGHLISHAVPADELALPAGRALSTASLPR